MRNISVEEIEEVHGSGFLASLASGIISGLIVDAMQNGQDSVTARTIMYISE